MVDAIGRLWMIPLAILFLGLGSIPKNAIGKTGSEWHALGKQER
jgi:hypothetical protein